MAPLDPWGVEEVPAETGVAARAGPAERRRRLEALVDSLKASGNLRDPSVESAMRSVDRALFLPPALKGEAYVDEPLSIGHGQTISAPHMVAILAEALQLEGGERVLEIGTGSGYNAAVVARLLPRGRVISCEIVPELAAGSIRALAAAGIANATVLAVDAGAGFADLAPYDVVYYTCAVPRLPEAVRAQVAPGGRLLVPLGRRECRLMRYRREPDGFREEDLGLCAFVPLTGAHV